MSQKPPATADAGTEGEKNRQRVIFIQVSNLQQHSSKLPVRTATSPNMSSHHQCIILYKQLPQAVAAAT